MTSQLELQNIPTLTEVIRQASERSDADLDAVIAEVQTVLASRTFQLADALLRSAFAQMEASLYEQISGQLRQQLPELIDSTLREHFEPRNAD